MRKYIIEIEDDPFTRYECLPGEEALYRANGFRSLVFDQNGLDKLTPYEEPDESAVELQGAEKAWELAKKISIMPDEAKKEVWGTDKYNTINLGYSYAEAAKRYEAWQKNVADDEIKVGDEVTDNYSTAVVLYTHGRRVGLLFNSGVNRGIAHETYKMEWKKTGRFFPELTEMLKKIGGKEE